jgi:hypothetical protein
MIATSRRPRAFASWHMGAIAFFAAGLLAGIAFAVAAPIVAIRTLGGLAALSAALGIATVAYAARLENPAIVVSWHAAADSLSAALGLWKRELALRVRHVDRSLENAIWSAMG